MFSDSRPSAPTVCTPPERAQLMARVFEQTGEAFLITDARNRIVVVNPAFTRLTGYSEAEALGRDPAFLASGASSPETYAAMWTAIRDKGYWHGEIWDRAKDGHVYPMWLTISVIRGEDGSIHNHVASFTDLSDRKEAAERIAFLAQHDSLTGLLNREALMSQLDHALATARREQGQVAVIMIDLDRFKYINDTLGHQVGDELLVAVAGRLRESVRISDIVARLGGDEFVLVLPDIENVMAVAGITSKLRRSLENPHCLEEHSLHVTPSIGVSLYPIDGGDAETLLKTADTAMYHAKAQGRNNVQFFAAEMNMAAMERLRLETALRQAIQTAQPGADCQFELHYQPQVQMDTGRIVGVEALLRWNHPEWGQVPPVKFVSIAEETGLIQPLGDWVFWEACRQLAEFKKQGVSGISVAVNLSAQQLRHEGLPSVVRGALACHELLPSELELEITESTAMQNPAATIAILDQLRDIGIVLAIDDFGTGYSSLAYLKHLPIQRLKLDRAFVKDIETDANDVAICSATIVLAHNLGLDMVAEGVETEGQRARLTSLGCDVQQGFLHSRPLPAGRVLPFLEEWAARHPPGGPAA